MDNRLILISVPLEELEGIFRKIIREEAKVCEKGLEINSGALLDRQQLAERLNVSTKTIATWVKKGKIPSMRVGTVDRFDYLQVRTALDKNRKR